MFDSGGRMMTTTPATLKADRLKQELAMHKENVALYEKTGDKRLERTRKRIGELETEIKKLTEEKK